MNENRELFADLDIDVYALTTSRHLKVDCSHVYHQKIMWSLGDVRLQYGYILCLLPGIITLQPQLKPYEGQGVTADRYWLSKPVQQIPSPANGAVLGFFLGGDAPLTWDH